MHHRAITGKGIEMKFCKKCDRETERQSSGNCKPCAIANNAAYRIANPEKFAARDAVYRAANLEMIRERKRAAHAANPDRARSYAIAYAAANPEKRRAYSATYYAENLEARRAYRAANPEARRAYAANRRARILAAPGTHTAADVKSLLNMQKGKCACCKTSINDGYHVDHVIPLAKEGGNDWHNLQLLCPTCNLQKSAKHPVEFMQSKGYLL